MHYKCGLHRQPNVQLPQLVLSVVSRILCFRTLYKPQGLGPKSQGFFQLAFEISRFRVAEVGRSAQGNSEMAYYIRKIVSGLFNTLSHKLRKKNSKPFQLLQDLDLRPCDYKFR